MPQFDAVVREVVHEAPSTVTLYLEAPVDNAYRAGQFINVDPHRLDATRALAAELQERKGKPERPRPYSLASAPHEPLLAITIKEEPAGEFPCLVSPHLVREVRVGDVLPCSGFNGLYVLPRDLPADAHVVHLCAGSGIVPNFAIIKDALHRGLPQRHTLLYGCRKWEEVIFRDELQALAREHPDSFEWTACLSRDPSAPAEVQVHHGRVDAALVQRQVTSLDDAWFFACGPSVPTYEKRAARARGETVQPRFLETIRAGLDALGVPKARINAEGW